MDILHTETSRGVNSLIIEGHTYRKVCYVEKFETPTNYSRQCASGPFGCSGCGWFLGYETRLTWDAQRQLCSTTHTGVVGKRAIHVSPEHRLMCRDCCTQSDNCNSAQNSCQVKPMESLDSCLSCVGVSNPKDCAEFASCKHANEVCFLHKYVTDANQELYDLGCTPLSVCLHSNTNGISFGRRGSGKRILCEKCCSGKANCNYDLSCDHTNNIHMGTKVEHSSCTFTNECPGNLVCKSGHCECVSSKYYWSGKTCLSQKNITESCTTTSQCKTNLNLLCIQGSCQCPIHYLWTSDGCIGSKLSNISQTVEDCPSTYSTMINEVKNEKMFAWVGVSNQKL
ncbi:unnamed protein product [Mytilus coruscus]|uniref:EB domain-containing protein n=1 Tax=Mytilus coruscus TaxID=42192 RepID=A0A6J8CC56_MYTCO|nr:unnamed protein product [Mytilus coruscus]